MPKPRVRKNLVESAILLLEYDVLAAKIGEINDRLSEIDANREAVNNDLRDNPVAASVTSYDALHRKHPDRETKAERATCPCWIFRYPGSPPDTAELSFIQLPPRETVTRASFDKDGKVVPALPELHNHFGRNITIVPVLEEREVDLQPRRYRLGRSESRLSTIVLPPGFAGGARHWPRAR